MKGRLWPFSACRDRLKTTHSRKLSLACGSCRPILLKKSERIDSTYTDLENRPIYALQALLAGKRIAVNRSSPTTYA